jgi:glycerol-3-phosphate dehydrogenase
MTNARSVSCDVLVIGGGATGAGTALDLALRGLRVILVEMNDWATGTSGRYHGLLHSGGRYAVRDPESARECIDENMILRKIAPHCLEETGGMFVAVPEDPPEYAEEFVKGCAASGIPTYELPRAEIFRRAPALNPAVVRAYDVPDAACDSFDLVQSLVEAAKGAGAQAWNYHQVTALEVVNRSVVGATVVDRHTGEATRIYAAHTVTAAGPWASEIAKLAGVTIRMRHSKGVMIAMNVRWVNTIINRLKPPSDGDILVPVGTVCVIGTTSVTVPRPDDLTITQEEITLMLDEGEKLIPGFRQARALRAWAGVRPLYESGSYDKGGRELKRTFEVLDHEKMDGVAGLTSIVGGKLTTYRLMAERVSDAIAAKLGNTAACMTASTPLPQTEKQRRFHQLPNRLDALEHAATHTGVICECELVTRPQLEQKIHEDGPTVKLDDLRRDLRLGMGPCQAGFCGYRAAGILQQTSGASPEQSITALRDFVIERFRGNRPLLWGYQLRQAMLDESIYRRTLGLSSPAEPDQAG